MRIAAKLIPAVLAAALLGADAIAGFPASRRALVFLGFVEPHREEKTYWCPMHPFYKVKRYGICPYCNMPLEEYKSGGDDRAEPVLVLTAQQIQQAGVRTEKVSRRALVREILTSGILEKNRERYWHIDTRFEGWVEELYINQEGETVKAGQPIAKIYSPQLYSTQNEYLLVRGDPELAQAARRRLQLLGIDEAEIQALDARGAPGERLTIRSPYEGVVVHRNVKPGMKLPMDGHIAEIADLRELWIFADVYDRDLALVSVGQKARIRVDAFPDTAFAGHLDLVEPIVRAETQTARVRIRVKNEAMRLLPGQFARVLLAHATEPVLAVSENAVIPTGRRDIVIAALGGGRFAAREVRLGRRWLTDASGSPSTSRGLSFFTGHDRFHEVLSGLREGEEVVTSGAFLLHAETQIRQLLEKMLSPKASEGEPVRSAWSGRPTPAPYMDGDLPFADEAESARYQADPSASWHARFPEIRQAMGRIFEQYFLVHTAVAEGKRELAVEYAEAFAGLLEDLTAPIADSFAADEAARLRGVASKLAGASAAIRAAATLAEVRRRFGEMSLALESWIEAYGPPVETLNQFYCGMAQRAVGSPTERWFQPDASLRNPFGMPGCGSLEKEFRPGVAPAPGHRHR